MKTKLLVSFVILALPALANAAPVPPKSATAELKNSKGEKVGTATFSSAQKGVTIKVEVSGLSPGEHGIHIHEKGKCETAAFKSAGGHLKTGDEAHGLKHPNHHDGDLPNLVVNAEGKADAEMTSESTTLAAGPHSLFRPEGTSLVIHAGKDDETSDPAGNSGDRVVCGVIGPSK